MANSPSLQDATFSGLTTALSFGPDFAKALDQHAAYCDALSACGVEVTVMPADEIIRMEPWLRTPLCFAGWKLPVVNSTRAKRPAGEVPVAATLRQSRPHWSRSNTSYPGGWSLSASVSGLF